MGLLAYKSVSDEEKLALCAHLLVIVIRYWRHYQVYDSGSNVIDSGTLPRQHCWRITLADGVNLWIICRN